MSSLVDSFLEDLEEEEEEDIEENDEDVDENDQEGAKKASSGDGKDEESDEEDNHHHQDQGGSAADESLMDVQDDSFAHAPSSSVLGLTVLHLCRSSSFQNLLKQVEEAMAPQASPSVLGKRPHGEDVAVEMNKDAYDLMVRCNDVLVDVSQEINALYHKLRSIYSIRFPELEELVMHPLDYTRVVKAIANEIDLTLGLRDSLSGILPASTIMGVTVAASSTSGVPLKEEELKEAISLCDETLELEESRQKILRYVESKMAFVAPNLSEIVGASVTALLVGDAGGLIALSNMPSCNLPSLGVKKRSSAGFSAGISSRAAPNKRGGHLFECDIIKNTPPAYHTRAIRLICGKCTIAARVDSFKQNQDGSVGKELKALIKKKLDKWQEPPPTRKEKALPAPDDKPRKRRGGRRARKMKEKYMMSELRKQQNRTAFGVEEGSISDLSGRSKGMGMIGQDGNGKLRLTSNEKNAVKRPKQKAYGGSSGATSGLSSSLAFTPVQGLELENPTAASDKLKTINQKYFSNMASFLKVKKDKEATE